MIGTTDEPGRLITAVAAEVLFIFREDYKGVNVPNVEEWGDSYVIGIEQLDQQHKFLFDLLHESYSLLMLKKCGGEEVIKILDSISDYATYHTSIEEDWMGRLKYPKQDEHTWEHEKFVQRVSQLNKGFKNESSHLMLEIVSFMRGWLMDHVLTHDREFGDFIREGASFCEIAP